MMFVGADSSAPFSPATPAGLYAWYDASDTATITVTSGSVTQWSDKSGGGHHLAQSAGSTAPVSGTRSQNGLNMIDFDGTNDYLFRHGSISFPRDTWTVFAVLVGDATTDNKRFCAIHTSGTGSGGWDFAGNGIIPFHAGTSANILTSTTASVDASLTGTGATPVDVYTVRKAAGTGSGNLVLMRGLGVATGTATTTMSGGANLTHFTVGAGWIGGVAEYVNGAFGELIFYGATLSDSDRDAVIGYLKTKWGV